MSGGEIAITKRDRQELADLYSEYHDRYGGVREDYFALLYLRDKFKCKIEDLASQVAFGGNDYGIDAYYIDREGRNLYLYQFKWSEDQNLFKDSLDRLGDFGLDRIFGDPLQDPEQNELVRNLREDLTEHRELVDRVYIRFVFKGDAEKAENSEGLADRKERTDKKGWLVQAYFGDRKVVFNGVEFHSDKRSIPKKPLPLSHAISVKNHISLDSSDASKTLHVAFVPLMDLFRIYRTLGQSFFDRNIRAGLSSENPPNKKIREALGRIVLKREEPPSHFSFNHNGVTLAVEMVEFEGLKAVIRVPRLLNGAQTITSLAKFLDDNQSHPSLKVNENLTSSTARRCMTRPSVNPI
ncbi:MAG TPA: AIPR family protein [Candidatus Acidoferrales bacterium]|nr:AIPR family protein [Candidatus Acidoferrales bacterium]